MNSKKEYAVGEEVQIGLISVTCIDSPTGCTGCYFDSEEAHYEYHSCKGIGNCRKEVRTDNKDVIFKLKTE